MKLSKLASNVGIGLAAGLAGTVAMTVSSTVEQKLRGREPSLAPAKALEKALGISRFGSKRAEERFSTLVHWATGTGWGALRGGLRTVGLPPWLATAGHFSAVWGGAVVTLPALEVAPPVTEWGADEVAIDLWHHAVYIGTTALAYEFLSRRAERSTRSV
jgi:hypothetical protein